MKLTSPYRHPETLWGGILLAVVAAGLLADAAIYGLHAGASVSEHVWAFGAAHPAINVGALVANLAYGWLVREDWKLVLLDGVVACHLWMAPVN